MINAIIETSKKTTDHRILVDVIANLSLYYNGQWCKDLTRTYQVDLHHDTAKQIKEFINDEFNRGYQDRKKNILCYSYKYITSDMHRHMH